MIDHLVAFTDEASAKADPAVGKYYVSSKYYKGWRQDCCIPSVFVWAPSQDITNDDGSVSHVPYDNLWRLIISLQAQDTAISASANCELVANRDLASTPAFLIQANLTPDQLGALMLSPMFAGMEVYPFGDPQLI